MRPPRFRFSASHYKVKRNTASPIKNEKLTIDLDKTSINASLCFLPPNINKQDIINITNDAIDANKAYPIECNMFIIS